MLTEKLGSVFFLNVDVFGAKCDFEIRQEFVFFQLLIYDCSQAACLASSLL